MRRGRGVKNPEKSITSFMNAPKGHDTKSMEFMKSIEEQHDNSIKQLSTIMKKVEKTSTQINQSFLESKLESMDKKIELMSNEINDLTRAVNSLVQKLET